MEIARRSEGVTQMGLGLATAVLIDFLADPARLRELDLTILDS